MKKILIMIIAILALTSCDIPSSNSSTTNLKEGIDVIGLNEEWIDQGCTLKIGRTTYQMDNESIVDTSDYGETIITYEETIDDVIYTCLRTVKVVDKVPPTAVLNPGIDTIMIGTTYIDPGITANDNYSTTEVVTYNYVKSDELGAYEIIYVVTDEELNTITLKRIVTVIE